MRITATALTITVASVFAAGCSDTHGGNGNRTDAAVGSTASASMATETPKPGLWTMTITADGMPKPMTSQLCVGPPIPGANPFSPPPQRGQVACSKNAFTKTSTGYSVASECKINGMTISTSGIVTGDYSAAYSIAMKTKMSGPNLPPSMQTERASTINAKYGGACPSGMAPGTARQAG